MSPNPGQVGHAERGWTHAICVQCWCERNPGRTPVTVTGDFATCCYCGQQTSAGIYVRDDPTKVHAA